MDSSQPAAALNLRMTSEFGDASPPAYWKRRLLFLPLGEDCFHVGVQVTPDRALHLYTQGHFEEYFLSIRRMCNSITCLNPRMLQDGCIQEKKSDTRHPDLEC